MDNNILSNEIGVLRNQLDVKSKELILNKIRNKEYGDLNIAIKSPNPSNERHWGDYFFAIALKKSFEKKGFNVFIHEKEYWYSHNQKIDITIVLRGLEKYIPNKNEINLMWNIYVPEDMYTEYDDYDIVFVASEKYANSIKNKVTSDIKVLLQCTDGTFVISDKIESTKTIFNDTIITYDDANDLNQKLQYYLEHDEERESIAKKGKEIVLKNHTFDHRVDTILNSLNDLKIN